MIYNIGEIIIGLREDRPIFIGIVYDYQRACLLTYDVEDSGFHHNTSWDIQREFGLILLRMDRDIRLKIVTNYFDSVPFERFECVISGHRRKDFILGIIQQLQLLGGVSG